jgi:cytochrome P450
MTMFILLMVLYPEVQRKAQAELDRVVGTSRLPDFGDREDLVYVKAVITELLRWYQATPMGEYCFPP